MAGSATPPYKTAMKTPASKILIVGQGLAGTVLGWSFNRAGIDWRMIDAGHETAASRVAAGIINPVTGQRWVKTWRIDELWAETRETYEAIGREFGVPLWREMKIRRYWRTEKERRVLENKIERGVLAPYVESIDGESCIIAPAARVDVQAMLTAAREKWSAEGRLTVARADGNQFKDGNELVIDCTGAAARTGAFGPLPWAISKGEILRVRAPDLDGGFILHRGHWLLPVEEGDAWLGATHEPGVDDMETTPPARETLLTSARRLTGRAFIPTGHLVGLRLATGDMRPVAGWHREHSHLGIMSGLGSKGVLYAPWLARQWVEQLTRQTAFDPDVAIDRYNED